MEYLMINYQENSSQVRSASGDIVQVILTHTHPTTTVIIMVNGCSH